MFLYFYVPPVSSQLFWWLNVPPDSNLHLALTQRYQGDLTIVPVSGLEDYLAVLQPPSKA